MVPKTTTSLMDLITGNFAPTMKDNSEGSCIDATKNNNKVDTAAPVLLDPSEEMVIFSDSFVAADDDVDHTKTSQTSSIRSSSPQHFPRGLDFGVDARKRKAAASLRQQEHSTKEQPLQQVKEEDDVLAISPYLVLEDWSTRNNVNDASVRDIHEEEEETDVPIMGNLAMAVVAAASQDPYASAVNIGHDEGQESQSHQHFSRRTSTCCNGEAGAAVAPDEELYVIDLL